MLQARESNHESTSDCPFGMSHASVGAWTAPRDIEQLLQGVSLHRRTLRAKEYVFRAGQPRRSLFLVHSGFFKTCLTSADGRDKITGFRMRGDMLGASTCQ